MPSPHLIPSLHLRTKSQNPRPPHPEPCAAAAATMFPAPSPGTTQKAGSGGDRIPQGQSPPKPQRGSGLRAHSRCLIKAPSALKGSKPLSTRLGCSQSAGVGGQPPWTGGQVHREALEQGRGAGGRGGAVGRPGPPGAPQARAPCLMRLEGHSAPCTALAASQGPAEVPGRGPTPLVPAWPAGPPTHKASGSQGPPGTHLAR